MIAGKNGVTGLPDSVKVTVLAWFHICTINCLFSDILKPYASIPPATQDSQQFHRPCRGCRCWDTLLCERRHRCSLSFFSHGNSILKPPTSASTSWDVQLVGQRAHTIRYLSPRRKQRWAGCTTYCQLDHAEFKEEIILILAYVSLLGPFGLQDVVSN